MTDEQQRIAIAKACGWLEYTQFTTYPKSWSWRGEPAKYHTPIWSLTLVANMTQDECTQYGWHGSGQTSIVSLPEYLNDLNAMHEAEKMLESDDNHAYGCYCSNLYEKYGNTVSLTARQRAQAFLRTLGKWEEPN